MTTETQADQPVNNDNTTTTDKGAQGADKPLSLRDDLEARLELDEKGPESSELSDAARRLAGARKSAAEKSKGKAPIDKVDEATLSESERVGKENAAKAKREAELAKLPEAERAKAIEEDKRKADEAAAASKLEAPAHWPAQVREMFAKQPPEVKSWILERHKAMEADYTKKMQELAPTKKFGEELDEIFRPHDSMIRQAGMTRTQAIRELVGWKERLDTNPGEAIKYLASVSGVDLKKLVEGGAAADPAGESPTVKALRDQVTQLTGQIKNLSGAQTEQQMNARLNEVTQFAEEKDDQGQLKRPHFDEVAQDVAFRIRAAKAEGKTLTLQEAYDSAVWANPTTRDKVLSARDAQRRAKEEAERKAKADAAKKAGFDVKGEGAATMVAATTTTLRESLEKAWDAQEGRV